MKIVLFQPQIPPNTGNIVRTCSVTGAGLILVEPLGFKIDDAKLKRAGLDYWGGVNPEKISDLPTYLSGLAKHQNFYFFSSKATKSSHEVNYQADDLLIFGSETTGLPAEYHERWPANFVTIPMINGARCLNLATSAGIALYEALRQQNFWLQQ